MPKVPVHINTLNQRYLQTLLRKDATHEEQQQALHDYLTAPERTEPVSCHCLRCQPSCKMCGGK